MKINLFKTAEIYAVLLITIGMMGCQPQSSSVATLAQTDRVVRIEAKTVPVKGAAKVVCEIEGCVRFDLQTVDSNIDWINQYFIERIQHTEPVAFTKVTQKNPKKADEPHYLDQRFIKVELVGQHAHLATFALKSSNLARNKNASLQHVEYINFDLKQRKRLALSQLLLNGGEQKLLNAMYRVNAQWLNTQGIQQQQLKLSDNYYFDTTSLVMVYPAGELAPAAAGMTELKVSYADLKEVIRPEYLAILQQSVS
ncbi:RsiV family protein [Acinetobacter lwoffii]|uniref:RsiV family protein n=1 Tax=Acinetobacter lwoffii TaxID=28090 RepID=UPI0021CDB712|nr:RsiV family protein [Acinetobacter lwoffii]MCU4439326.1 RsiV family protein [Acinetobacter lwoffii]